MYGNILTLYEQVEVLLSQFEWKSRDSPTETRLTDPADRYRNTDSLTPANFSRAVTVQRMANDVTYTKYTALPIHLRVQSMLSPSLLEVKGRVIHNSVEHQKPDMFTESSGLDDFGEDRSPQLEEREGEGGREEGEGEMGDFADELRRRIEREFDDQEEINGFQVTITHICRQYTVHYVFDTPLSITFLIPACLPIACVIASSMEMKM